LNPTFNLEGSNAWVLLGIPALTVLVYLPSVLFTMIVMRIPWVQRIVIYRVLGLVLPVGKSQCRSRLAFLR